jgi:hypothetical protein
MRGRDMGDGGQTEARDEGRWGIREGMGRRQMGRAEQGDR